MYESPIEIMQAVETASEQLQEDIKNAVIKQVYKIGVKVDAEELEKALLYDRHQYQKGYDDAKRLFTKAISDLTTQTPFHGNVRYDEYTDCWVTSSGDRYKYYHGAMISEEQYKEKEW